MHNTFPFNDNESNKDPARFQETSGTGAKDIGTTRKRTISSVFRTMFPPKKVEGLVETAPETRRGEGNPFVGKRSSQTHSERAQYVSVMKDQQEVQKTPDLSKETNDDVAWASQNYEKLRSAASKKNVPI